MTTDNTSLESIWSQTVGEDPTDPYLNCNSCELDCANQALNDAAANVSNFPFNMKAAAKNDFLAPQPSAMDILRQEEHLRAFNADQAAKKGARAMVDLGPSRRYPISFSPNRGGGGSRSSSGFEATSIGSENPLGQTGSVGFRWSGNEVSWDPDNFLNETSGSVVVVPEQGITDVGNAAGSLLRETFNPTPDPVTTVSCSTDTAAATAAVPATPTTSGLGATGSQSAVSATQGTTVTGGGGLNQAGGGSVSSVKTGVNNNGVATQGNGGFRGVKATIRP